MLMTMVGQIVSQWIPIWFWIVPIRWSIIHFYWHHRISIFTISDYLLLIMNHLKNFVWYNVALWGRFKYYWSRSSLKIWWEHPDCCGRIFSSIFFCYEHLAAYSLHFKTGDNEGVKGFSWCIRKQLLGVTTGNVIENVLYRLFRQALKCS